MERNNSPCVAAVRQLPLAQIHRIFIENYIRFLRRHFYRIQKVFYKMCSISIVFYTIKMHVNKVDADKC